MGQGDQMGKNSQYKVLIYLPGARSSREVSVVNSGFNLDPVTGLEVG
jgi:hypothetical protein